MFSRALRIIAGLTLIGAGLGLLGAVVHTEGAMHDARAVAKARHIPASTFNARNRLKDEAEKHANVGPKQTDKCAC
jgi:hypothetical protein